jgi:predicted NBD/HSP70 family sugar kinase
MVLPEFAVAPPPAAPLPQALGARQRRLTLPAATAATVIEERPALGRSKHTPVEQLRVLHRGEVVRALRDHGPQSRVELCARLQRSSTTLSKVIGDLLDGGWVTESAPQRHHGLGRPRTALALVPEACKVLALLIEPDAVHAAACGLDARPGAVHSRPAAFAAQQPAASVEELAHLVIEAQRAERAAGRHPLRAVSIALPGLTDTRLRTLLRSTQIGWRQLALADALESRTGLPVLVHNNTRAMAFAEFRHLGLTPEQPMLFLQARFGLGAAMVNSASSSSHSHYGASDLGYIPLAVNGFAHRVPTDRHLVSVTNEAYLCRVLGVAPGGGLLVLQLLEQRRAAGDPTARQLYGQTLDNLATGLGIAVDILAPRVIVLGGIYAHAGDGFAADLRARLQGRAQPELVEALVIQRSALGRLGGLQGAALVAFDRLLTEPQAYLPT